MSELKQKIWNDILQVRELSPLVLNITNYVVMNNTANALLAAGASPIMANAPEEIEEMTTLCAATVINIGTLNAPTVESMKLALSKASELGKPTILDPVGAGATSYRNRTVEELLGVASPTFIRGNAGEIMTLAGMSVASKGVDSTVSSAGCEKSAKSLAKEHRCVVSVSGETDVITDGTHIAYIDNGDQLMCRVTGLGCTASAILGAFAVVQPNRFMAAISAAAYMGVCGEIAARESIGPGSLQLNLYDVMHTLTERQFTETVRVRGK